MGHSPIRVSTNLKKGVITTQHRHTHTQFKLANYMCPRFSFPPAQEKGTQPKTQGKRHATLHPLSSTAETSIIPDYLASWN